MNAQQTSDAPLAQHINDLIPKTLDDIIREKRDLVELGLATTDEINALQTNIPQKYLVKDVIDDWRLIALRDKTSGQAQLLLLGYSQTENVSWLTSSVIQIDLDNHCIMTKSLSKYALGTKGEGEPSRGQLMHICATFHQWGSGTLLGMPHFFY